MLNNNIQNRELEFTLIFLLSKYAASISAKHPNCPIQDFMMEYPFRISSEEFKWDLYFIRFINILFYARTQVELKPQDSKSRKKRFDGFEYDALCASWLYFILLKRLKRQQKLRAKRYAQNQRLLRYRSQARLFRMPVNLMPITKSRFNLAKSC